MNAVWAVFVYIKIKRKPKNPEHKLFEMSNWIHKSKMLCISCTPFLINCLLSGYGWVTVTVTVALSVVFDSCALCVCALISDQDLCDRQVQRFSVPQIEQYITRKFFGACTTKPPKEWKKNAWLNQQMLNK